MGTCRWKYKYKSNYDYTHRKNTSYKQEGLHMQVQIWVGSTISWSHNGIVFFGCQRMPWRANTWFANVYSWSWSVGEDIECHNARRGDIIILYVLYRMIYILFMYIPVNIYSCSWSVEGCLEKVSQREEGRYYLLRNYSPLEELHCCCWIDSLQSNTLTWAKYKYVLYSMSLSNSV